MASSSHCVDKGRREGRTGQALSLQLSELELQAGGKTPGLCLSLGEAILNSQESSLQGSRVKQSRLQAPCHAFPSSVKSVDVAFIDGKYTKGEDI